MKRLLKLEYETHFFHFIKEKKKFSPKIIIVKVANVYLELIIKM